MSKIEPKERKRLVLGHTMSQGEDSDSSSELLTAYSVLFLPQHTSHPFLHRAQETVISPKGWGWGHSHRQGKLMCELAGEFSLPSPLLGDEVHLPGS